MTYSYLWLEDPKQAFEDFMLKNEPKDAPEDED